MSVLTYKCPNCGGSLIFQPKTQQYACEYCLSEFDQTALDASTPEADSHVNEDAALHEEVPQEEEISLYTCPSCGAQIAADPTTAATFCYYCHNPIVLSGRLSGDQMPSHIVPFQITKEEAKEQFLAWIRGKTYLPPAFYSPAQIERLSGIYFPYWTLDCTLQADLHTTARDLRVWRSHDTEYTETKTYAIHRLGEISLQSLKEETDCYAKSLLSHTITSHQHLTTDSFRTYNVQHKWHYTLLPVWILTYQHQQETYYFAMNGQTGEICGRLPIHMRKLVFTCASIFAAITAGITLLGGLLL